MNLARKPRAAEFPPPDLRCPNTTIGVRAAARTKEHPLWTGACAIVDNEVAISRHVGQFAHRRVPQPPQSVNTMPESTGSVIPGDAFIGENNVLHRLTSTGPVVGPACLSSARTTACIGRQVPAPSSGRHAFHRQYNSTGRTRACQTAKGRGKEGRSCHESWCRVNP